MAEVEAGVTDGKTIREKLIERLEAARRNGSIAVPSDSVAGKDFLQKLQERKEQVRTDLWATDPHEYGPGKIHIVNAEKREKTLCGKWLRAMPGKYVSGVNATCSICLGSFENRKHRGAQEEEWRRRNARRSFERSNESREWWEKYTAYLRSPAWFEKRDAVMKRAGGICEGCGKRSAVQVHHLSYEHVKLVPGSGLVCEELLWELRAVCNTCHDRIHK